LGRRAPKGGKDEKEKVNLEDRTWGWEPASGELEKGKGGFGRDVELHSGPAWGKLNGQKRR